LTGEFRTRDLGRRPRAATFTTLAQSLCLIVVLAVACGLASPFARTTDYAARPDPEVQWRRSQALGSPSEGRLLRGVQLPAEDGLFFTWDPLLHRQPDRGWRRWGTDGLVRTVLAVVDRYAAGHPGAPRLGIGDLSRSRGGYFGPRHVSHQNGLDVDVYYPRRDRRERAPLGAWQIDRRLSQALVDLFVAAGAVRVFVGPNTGLTGPPGIVQVLWNHDNHLHVRMPPGT
jgi:murein endopeptidase